MGENHLMGLIDTDKHIKDGGNTSWQTRAASYFTFIRLYIKSKLFPADCGDKQHVQRCMATSVSASVC